MTAYCPNTRSIQSTGGPGAHRSPRTTAVGARDTLRSDGALQAEVVPEAVGSGGQSRSGPYSGPRRRPGPRPWSDSCRCHNRSSRRRRRRPARPSLIAVSAMAARSAWAPRGLCASITLNDQLLRTGFRPVAPPYGGAFQTRREEPCAEMTNQEWPAVGRERQWPGSRAGRDAVPVPSRCCRRGT